MGGRGEGGDGDVRKGGSNKDRKTAPRRGGTWGPGAPGSRKSGAIVAGEDSIRPPHSSPENSRAAAPGRKVVLGGPSAPGNRKFGAMIAGRGPTPLLRVSPSSSRAAAPGEEMNMVGPAAPGDCTCGVVAAGEDLLPPPRRSPENWAAEAPVAGGVGSPASGERSGSFLREASRMCRAAAGGGEKEGARGWAKDPVRRV